MAGLFRVIGRNDASRATLITMLVVAATGFGCDRGSAASTANPRSAARAFVTAMNTGDAVTLAAVSTGDEVSLQLLVSLAKLNAAYARLEKVATEKFGDPKSVFAYPRARDHYAIMAKEIDQAPETLDGATATIGKGLGAVHLRKTGDEWKVDRARHAPPSEGIASAIAMSDALAKAYVEVAAGIADGSLRSAEEAKAVLMGKQQQAVIAQAGTPSTTLPTSRPATLPVP